MKESGWIYRVGDEEKGPFTLEEITHKLQEGEIDEETLVKGGGFVDWKHLKEVKELNVDFLDPHPPVKKPELEERDREKEETMKRWTRPWVRFWARMIDYSLFTLLLLAFFKVFNLYPYSVPIYIHPTLMTLVWVFVEAGLYTTWGTTPGKWFLATHVECEDGSRPTYCVGLARSFCVWWLGFGAALPVIAIITSIVANVKLSNNGITTWDKMYHYNVIHKKIGFIRTFATVVYFLLYASVFSELIP